MGTTNTGALIVIERNNNLDFLTNTGDEMNILSFTTYYRKYLF